MHHDRETGHFTVSADIHVSICGCNLLLTINAKKIRNSFFGYVQEVFVSLFLCLFIPDKCALSAKHSSLAHKIKCRAWNLSQIIVTQSISVWCLLQRESSSRETSKFSLDCETTMSGLQLLWRSKLVLESFINTWMHFCREQSLKFMRHMPESRLLQLANSTDILVSVENYQSCYLELLSMNTSRYGLSSNDMFCSSGFIKLCNIGNCIKGTFLKALLPCTCKLSSNEFEDSLF